MSAEFTFAPDEPATIEAVLRKTTPSIKNTFERKSRIEDKSAGQPPSSTRISLVKRSVFFLIEAAVLLAAIYLFGQNAGQMPSILIACIWAIVSAFSAVALAYPYIIRKKNTKEMFLDNSFAANRINGRFLCMIVCYVLSAILIASLMMEVQKWEQTEFLIAAAAIPLFLVIALATDSIMKRKVYKPKYRLRGTVIVTRIIAGIALTLIFAFASGAFSTHSQLTLGQAFSNTELLFENSQSAVLTELGKLNYLLDGYTTFGMSQLQPIDLILYCIVSLFIFASSAFGLSQLFSVCFLNRHELLEAFRPIEEGLDKKARNAARLQTTLVICLGSLVLIGAFLFADHRISDFQNTGNYSASEQFVQKMVDINVYEVDGKTYEKSTVDDTIESLIASDPTLSQQRNELIQSLKTVYDTYAMNIDSYLDWYYRSGWERLPDDAARALLPITSLFGASAPADPTLQEKLAESLDVAGVESQIQEYNDALMSLRSQVVNALSGKELSGIPKWLVNSQASLDDYFATSTASTSLSIAIPEEQYENREEHWRAINNAIESSKKQTLGVIQSENFAFMQHEQPEE